MHVSRRSALVLGLLLSKFVIPDSAQGQVQRAWAARYAEPQLGLHDEASAVAVDDAGNTIVTGRLKKESGADYGTVKYDPNGNELWVARLTAGSPNALAVDSAGNVYVTGSFYKTVKYDSDGNELWVARLADGEAAAIAVDATGNVYVTGTPVGAPDYLTGKFDPNGNELWVARYDGPSSHGDYPSALGVDSAGNVYVTGESEGEGLTVKYDENGNMLWGARFPGSATAMALDSADSFYVTGTSQGSDTALDYTTAKYDSGGNQLWVARYDGAGFSDFSNALAVDSAGNVYVTGHSFGSGTGDDYATVKYDPEGNELWAARYDRAPADYPIAIALDSSANVYVMGRSGARPNFDCATVKYDPDGNEAWVALYEGHAGVNDLGAMAVDENGNVSVVGYSEGLETGRDFLTLRYDWEGNELWVARYNPPSGGDDSARAMVVDAAGNVYVTGSSQGSDGHSDYATVKYDSDGNELWVARYDGSASGSDAAEALGVDSDGNVYVTGASLGFNFRLNYATMKYDTNGNQLWMARYGEPDTGGPGIWATAIAVDTGGNAYVTGGSGRSNTTVKYDVKGNELWVASSSGGAGAAISVDASGNVYVMGDHFLSKYNSNGDELWSVSNTDGEFTAMAVAGDVYVTGNSEGESFTVKYDSDGNELWGARCPGGNATALALDSAGNAYVTGFSGESGTGSDYATVKYDSDGIELWAARYDGPASAGDTATALAVDSAGNAYVTGFSGESGTGSDYTTVKYDSDGNELWVARYDGPGKGPDEAIAVAVDGAGSVYVTGASEGSGSGKDYATVKYVEGTPFLRGDSNADGEVDISDAINTLKRQFLGEGEILCDDAADANDDGQVDISDPVITLDKLFLGNAEIPGPGITTCGTDPTDDILECESYTAPCES